MKKRIIAALLFCTMLLTAGLSACNDDGETSSTEAEQSGQSEQSQPTESSEAEKYLVPHLGKRDLGGFTFTFLACEPEGLYNNEQFAPEEEMEEPINDAVYNRNRLLEDEYNCDIEVIWAPAFYQYESKVEQDILTGINEYNVCVTGVQTLGHIANKGYFYDLLNLEGSNLNLEESWWDKSANDSMTICNKLFFATGDVTVSDDLHTMCIYFNKDMVADKGLDNPYQLVYDDKWTLDAMHQMCLDVAVPGGDGVMNMDGEDTWGFVAVAFDTYKLIIGTNSPQIERDENGDPIIAMTNERNVNAFNKVQEFMNDKACCAYIEQWYRWDDYDNNHAVKDHFYNGQALFLADEIAAVGSAKMLETTFNYGVLPCPKYDEEQEEYVDGIDPYRFYAVAIPKLTEMDIDKTTFVLEAIAYLNDQMVTPKFYEVTLKEKRFKDDDAPVMLDTIFANRCVDLSVIFNWNDCIQYYNQLLNANQSVLSFMESKGPAMEAAMQECIETLRDIEN